MVYRVFVEKKPGLDNEARELRRDARTFLGIKGLEKVRLLNRYDAEDMPEELFSLAVREVFSEPQLDDTMAELSAEGAAAVFAVEYLPGQFDQRADSAAQCIQFISRGERPLIRSAKVYILYGTLTEAEILEIKKYVINPVEAREASLDKPETLRTEYAVPTEVATLEGFTALDRAGLEKFVADYGLAMDTDDIAFCQSWFREEGREPTITEIRMLDTYWSDHCRHTTFLTEIDSVSFEDAVLEKSWKRYLDTRKELGRENKPVCLMDLATVAAKYLRKNGKLDKLDESEEINACTVKMDVERDGVKEPWLLLFKNETHNHPTEIEPFGGAATCIGGAIRDPLSGRAYVYGAMRVTGAADPTRPVSETIPGKLPQRKLVTTAAAGYPRLCGQADGDRRGHRGGAGRERPPGMPGSRGYRNPPGRFHRPGRHRRRDRIIQGAQCAQRGDLRRGGAEGQRAGGAEAAAAVPQPEGDEADQTLQRLRSRRCERCHRRTGRRTGYRPERGAEEI